MTRGSESKLKIKARDETYSFQNDQVALSKKEARFVRASFCLSFLFSSITLKRLKKAVKVV